MNKAKIFQDVAEYLREEKGYEGGVTNETTVQELGFDSLDTAEMAMDLEKKYDISIPEKEAEKMENVGAIVDIIAAQLGVTE